MKQTEFIH